jgi:hypothetical protein
MLFVGFIGLTNSQSAAQLLDQGPASQGPRVLVPGNSGAAAQPTPSAGPVGNAAGNIGGDGSGPPSQLPAIPAPVAVGDLGTVEGPIAGILNDLNGGLGQDMWAATGRADAEMLIQRVPAALTSPTSRLLFRQVLLTEAPLPVGVGNEPFNGLRIQRLLEIGELTEAGALAARVRSRDPQTQRMQADAMLYAGRDIELCGDATNERLQSADPFWVDLRAYCYHFDGDSLALDLTRTVMEQQNLADPALFHLLDAFDADEPTPPDVIANPNAVHLRLLMRHGLPIPIEAIANLGTPGSIIAASLPQMPLEIRRQAVEQIFRSGALPASVMREVFSASEIMPGDLNLAATLARGEEIMPALERIFGALEIDGRTDRRAELIQLAFQIGRNEGLLPQIAQLFSEEAAAIFPAPNWEAWAPMMIRGLLAADQPAAAERWYNILNPQLPAHYLTSRDAAIVFAISRRETPYVGDAQSAIAELALQSLDPAAPANVLARTALILGLFDALGLDMPQEARAQVQPLVSNDYPGRTPARAIMQRVDSAASATRRGELALVVLEALGPRGAADMAPNVIVGLVRALNTAGMRVSAQALAAEAILTWQGG